MKTTFTPISFPRKILTTFICTAGISLFAQTVSAQIGGASVYGVIAAQTVPQQGLEVVAKNIDNGYTFRAITQKDGTYIFKGLSPGKYQILLQDKKASETVLLKVGQSVSLNFELEKPATEKVEEIVVIGTQLRSKNNGGEIDTTVSLEQISKLPQNTRNFLAFADLAPGVQFTQASDGSTSIKGGAQNPDAVNVFIDGVGQKNYVLRGGITGQDSSRGNPFPQSAIGQYKVITQNYSAEYDQLSSAAIVAVTASGTNEFHGGVFADYTDEGMRKLRPSEFSTQKKVPSEQKQFGVHVGGPIIQDKMHFFFAYEGKKNSDPKDVIPEGGYTQATLPVQFQSEVGGRSADFDEDLYFGKLDYLISDQQKIELTAKLRNENELTNVGGVQSLSFGTDKKNDETRIDLSHNWRTDNWINDSHLTYEDANYNPRPHTIGNGIKLTNDAGKAVLNVGGGENFQDKGQSGWSIQDDFSYLAIKDHVLKTGIKYKSIKLNATQQEPYNPQYEYNLGYSTTLPYRVKWGAPLAGIGDGSAEADNFQLGLYVQDDWTATDRLTLNIGVRWDYEESDSYLDYKTPNDVLTGISSWAGIQNSDININDYISDGSNRDAFKNAWQPRIGFVYDLSDDNDVAIFGGAGRAYDRNLFDNLQLESTKATFPTYEINFVTADPQHTGCNTNPECVAWDPVYLTREGLAQLETGDKGANREVFMVNNKLKTPYSDQFSLGIRGSIADWKAEASLSRIVSKDGFVWLLANRHPDGTFFNPGTTWGPPWGNGIPGFGSTIIGTNGIETKTNSLFLKFDKPKEDTNWGLTFAYTYSQAKTNRESGETFAFDYPNLEGYGMHDANKIPEHRIVVASVVTLPLDIDLSAKLNLNRGLTYYGTDCRAGWNDCVFNRFKPDGWFKQLDIAFSKNIATGSWVEDSSITVRLDVLNIWNSINPDGYDTWFGGAGESLPAHFGTPNDSIAGPMRTVKFGINWNW